MANGFQATLDGDELVITCDGEWGCCQRKQAKQKVRDMNDVIQAKPNQTSTVKTGLDKIPRVDAKGAATTLAALTDKHRQKEWDQRRNMTKNEKAKDATTSGQDPCLEAEMKKTNPPAAENDHSLDVKLCGDYDAPLVPTDRNVNNSFGKIAQNASIGRKISKVVLVCPKDAKCAESHNTGEPSNPKSKRPKPFVERTQPYQGLSY